MGAESGGEFPQFRSPGPRIALPVGDVDPYRSTGRRPAFRGIRARQIGPQREVRFGSTFVVSAVVSEEVRGPR
ncbi:hypothetical protein GCM10027089_53420 [Nocardia thraciensis]